MQIVSFVFGIFLAIVYFLLYTVDRFCKDGDKAVNASKWILLIASYVFVSYLDYRFALVLLVLTFSTWFFSMRGKYRSCGIIVAVLVLGFFKYTNFFVGSFQRIIGNDYTALNIILPLGISFYSFSAIGYLVDLGRNKMEPRNLKDVALYLAFFPKITSGPIQRSGEFFGQMDQRRRIGWDTFSIGIQVFMFGLFKKIVLADHLSVFVNQVYDVPEVFGSLTVFMAAIAYSLQIYFDFSGYSDLAVGVSKIIGVDLPVNFNLPYLSHNVTEFWKRWHITLSSWLQEYLYIPLGGSWKGKGRTYANLVMTMVLGGLWHGANGTYIVWGLFHGVALVIHKVFMKITKSAERPHQVFANLVSVLCTFLFTTFCWVFFRADSIVHALEILKQMFCFRSGLEQPYMWLFVAVTVLVIGSLAAAIKSKRCGRCSRKQNVCNIHGFYPILDLTKFWHLVLFFVFSGLILCLAYTGGSPFIYGNY